MTTIGIIGYGNMGSCIAERLKSRYDILVFDKDRNKLSNLSGIKSSHAVTALVQKADVIILAVKPQDCSIVLGGIKSEVKGKLVISIAAGIPTRYIEKHLGTVRVVRAMPNMPARIGKAITCLCKGAFSTDDDLGFAKELFDHLGQTLSVDENMMDAVTAISGSGPGYYYDMIETKKINLEDDDSVRRFNEGFVESLSASAHNIGFSSDQARLVATITVEGSYELLKETHVSLQELKKQIASKGGTTEAGLAVLHNGGSLDEAVAAARDRAQELSKK